MTDDHTDDDVESRLRELWETPVGRRWLLKAGLGSAAAVGAQVYAGPAVAAARRIGGDGPTGQLQFALGALPGITQLTVVADGVGSGQFTDIALRGRVRFVRITLAAASSSWWSVADVRAYA